MDGWLGRSPLCCSSRADRPNANAPFSQPMLVKELSSSQDELMSWISKGECAVYFARSTAQTTPRIFQARRPT
jgi:hypothetical protein